MTNTNEPVRTLGTLAVTVLICVFAVVSVAEERTLDEFKVYASEKLPALSEAQLQSFANAVDQNGDGTISDAEFSNRLAALRNVAAGNLEEPNRDNSPRGRTDSDQEAVRVSVLPLTSASNSTLLLITGDEIAGAWNSFAQWKTRSGKATKIVTVGQIERDYEATSIQEKIRLCVRDHIENHGTRWVVLGGDCLPGGKGVVPGGHVTVHAQEPNGIPTDIVYLSKSNWDADGDGVYGEWIDDRDAISYPDGTVGLGRVPVRTAADVAAFTEKVIAYESRYPTTGFAKQMIYTCTDSPAYPKVRKSWDTHVSKAWDGGRVGRFFSQETPWDKDGEPGSHELSGDNLVELINGGTTSKMHIHGHGHLPSWVLETSEFTDKHVGKLSNDGAYPLLTTVSCNTGEFDSHLDPSIVELMIRKPKGGSVAIVAPIRTGKPHFHRRSDFRLMVLEGKLDGTTHTMTRYWSNGLGLGLTTGEAIMRAKSAMADDARKTAGYHLCICELNLLGDPSLDMRAETPRTPKLSVPKRIGTGEQTIAIETDAPGSTICLWKGLEIYQVVQADDAGRARIQIIAKTGGDLLVTAAGANLNTATAKIKIAANERTLPQP